MKTMLLNLLNQQNTGYSSIYIKSGNLRLQQIKKWNLLLEGKIQFISNKKIIIIKIKGIILNNFKNKSKFPKLIIELSKYEII